MTDSKLLDTLFIMSVVVFVVLVYSNTMWAKQAIAAQCASIDAFDFEPATYELLCPTEYVYSAYDQ